MLERFKVPANEQIYVEEEALRHTVTAIFEKVGLSRTDAMESADVLVTADLRGVESHGVSNMLRRYVEFYQDEVLNPLGKLTIISDTPSAATVDADRALGITVGRRAMEIAVDKARKTGVGAVTMFNSGHMGALGHYAMIAVQNNMIGFSSTAAGTGVVPTFASEPRFGTNPFAFAAPTRNEAPILFDVATTAVAGNKLELARRLKASLLPGWIAELDGTPITQETEARGKDEYYQLPIGGSRESGSHKGYGLALMVEVLGSLLSGSKSGMIKDESDWIGSKSFFTAYNIEAFTNMDEFMTNIDEMLSHLIETKPSPGNDRVLYPGLIEHEEFQKRALQGIPLHTEVIDWFDQITKELSLDPLELLEN